MTDEQLIEMGFDPSVPDRYVADMMEWAEKRVSERSNHSYTWDSAEMYCLFREIKRLRAQNDQLRAWLDEARSVIEAYQTPNVDNIEVNP